MTELPGKLILGKHNLCLVKRLGEKAGSRVPERRVSFSISIQINAVRQNKALPDNSFVKQRIDSLAGNHCQGRVWTDNIVEIIVVYVEGLVEGLPQRDTRRHKDLSRRSTTNATWGSSPWLTVVRFDSEGGGTGCRTLKLLWSTTKTWEEFACAETDATRAAKPPMLMDENILWKAFATPVGLELLGKVFLGQRHHGYLNFLRS
jgi:hypothetical protein